MTPRTQEESRLRIPDDKLITVIKKAYDLSEPKGMGHLHYTPGPMTDDEARSVISKFQDRTGIHLDYLQGRAVKLSIWKDDYGYFISDRPTWFDHSQAQWTELKGTFL